MKSAILSVLFASFVLSTSALADPQMIRWTGAEDKDASLDHVVSVVNAKGGLSLAPADFVAGEERDLANNHFKTYLEAAAGVPMKSLSIRVWTDLKTGEAIQVEAFVDTLAKPAAELSRLSRLGMSVSDVHGLIAGKIDHETMRLVRAAVAKNPDDREMRGVKLSTMFDKGELVRIAKVKGKRGTHTITISVARHRVIGATYEEFPQGDLGGSEDSEEFSVRAQVYPIYEEGDNDRALLPRIPAELKYLRKRIGRSSGDLFEGMRTQHYYGDHYDPILGETEAGRAQGYWSMSYVKRQAAALREALAKADNSYENGGVILEGRYATISLDPAAAGKFKGIDFTPAISSQFKPDWITAIVDGNEMDEMIPRGSLLGRPLLTADEAWNRPARRLPDHDPASYINDGFDELQVYYAINTLFDSLRARGWTDPELSTRPFNAFLYNPDISMRDNAFYTDDTINFTTYSPSAGNAARDNSTIWHELGHGVMDRLMGDNIQLADTGGLSEGMADFVAALVIQSVTDGKPFPGSNDFRIINHTGFLLTNEVHDDGEAYGGSMRDILVNAIAADAEGGLRKMTDLTLETMRLTRNHPGLTAQDWFNHMIFADSLGHEGVRAPGELKETILTSLASRNFALDGSEPATFSVKNGETEVVAGGEGSRSRPVRLALAKDEKASFTLNVQVKDSEHYHFKFPVQIRVYHNRGALQGAIQWDGEEASGSATPAQVVTLHSADEAAQLTVTANGTCQYANRDDGSCVDYAYVQVWNDGETWKPQAKKRFYLRVKTKTEN